MSELFDSLLFIGTTKVPLRLCVSVSPPDTTNFEGGGYAEKVGEIPTWECDTVEPWSVVRDIIPNQARLRTAKDNGGGWQATVLAVRLVLLDRHLGLIPGPISSFWMDGKLSFAPNHPPTDASRPVRFLFEPTSDAITVFPPHLYFSDIVLWEERILDDPGPQGAAIAYHDWCLENNWPERASSLPCAVSIED